MELGENALNDFAKSDERAEAGKRLLAKVEFTYALAAKLAHREQTVEGTAAIWAKMVAICDQVAEAMRACSDHNPAALDRILDFRNAAERRRELHS